MSPIRHVLAIETSCDDTSVAVVRADGWVVSMTTQNQDEKHAPFGGIVPEIAGRAHAETLIHKVHEAVVTRGPSWSEIDGIAVTSEPGLIGSLLVGVVTAKSLAMAKQLPLIGVNHIEGHLFAGFAKDDKYTPPEGFETPFLALAVSGGHTSLVEVKALGDYKLLGATADDAAGEALDKFAKLIGLGFPGGAQVDQWARKGDRTKYPFPLAREHDETLQMSFSGLKSSAVRLLNSLTAEQIQNNRADLCASFQHAVVESLILKLQAALKRTGLKRLVVTGGVSANSELRARAEKLCADQGVQLMMPPLRYCTDNAAMIGVVGMRRLLRGDRSDMSLSPSPLSHLELTAYVST